MKTIAGISVFFLLTTMAGCTGADVIQPAIQQAPCVALIKRGWKLQSLTVNGNPAALSAQSHMSKYYSQADGDINKGNFTTTDIKGRWVLHEDCKTLEELYTGANGTFYNNVYTIVTLDSSVLKIGYTINGSAYEEIYTPL